MQDAFGVEHGDYISKAMSDSLSRGGLRVISHYRPARTGHHIQKQPWRLKEARGELATRSKQAAQRIRHEGRSEELKQALENNNWDWKPSKNPLRNMPKYGSQS